MTLTEQFKDNLVFAGFFVLLAILFYFSVKIFFLRRCLFRDLVADDPGLSKQFPDRKLHHMLRLARSPLGNENVETLACKNDLLRHYRVATIWAGIIVGYIVFAIVFV